MGVTTGFIALLCLILLLLNFLSRKLNLTKVKAFLMKHHKSMALVLLAIVIIHLGFALTVFKTRDLEVNLTGFIALFIIIATILLCFSKKANRFKLHKHLALALTVVVIAHIVAWNIDFKHYQEGVKNIQISNVDLNSIDDGTYEGYSDVGYIKAKVEVTVKDGKLTSIKLIEHLNERGSRAEAIIGHMLKEQRIDVDSITGATNSSLVIKDAVQKALSAK